MKSESGYVPHRTGNAAAGGGVSGVSGVSGNDDVSLQHLGTRK